MKKTLIIAGLVIMMSVVVFVAGCQDSCSSCAVQSYPCPSRSCPAASPCPTGGCPTISSSVCGGCSAVNRY